MADDFTGVPTDDLDRLRGEIRLAFLLAVLALLLFSLTAFALLRSGTLPHGWLLPGHAHG